MCLLSKLAGEVCPSELWRHIELLFREDEMSVKAGQLQLQR
jgi:hypothetical protein